MARKRDFQPTSSTDSKGITTVHDQEALGRVRQSELSRGYDSSKPSVGRNPGSINDSRTEKSLNIQPFTPADANMTSAATGQPVFAPPPQVTPPTQVTPTDNKTTLERLGFSKGNILDKVANFLQPDSDAAIAASIIPFGGLTSKGATLVKSALSKQDKFYLGLGKKILSPAGRKASDEFRKMLLESGSFVERTTATGGLNTAKVSSAAYGSKPKRTAFDVIEGLTNTKTAAKTISWVNKATQGLKNNKVVASILLSLPFATTFWAPDSKNDAMTTLSILARDAAENVDPETLDYISELIEETDSINPWIPVLGFTQAQIAKSKAAVASVRVTKETFDRLRREAEDKLLKEQERDQRDADFKASEEARNRRQDERDAAFAESERQRQEFQLERDAAFRESQQEQRDFLTKRDEEFRRAELERRAREDAKQKGEPFDPEKFKKSQLAFGLLK